MAITEPYVVSLTAIPSRFPMIQETLRSLLAQDAKPEVVQLYIPQKYRRFPEWDGVLPDVPKGVEIVRPQEDLGPATKVLFAADAFKGQSVRIIYCDDDRIFLPDWASRLLSASEAHPDCAIVSSGFEVSRLGADLHSSSAQPRAVRQSSKTDWKFRIHRLWQDIRYGGAQKVPYTVKATRNYVKQSGYVDIAEGLGGVLIKPDFFDQDCWDIPPIMWTVDDIWLSGHLARRGIPIWAVKDASRYRTTPMGKQDALNQTVIDGADRRSANRQCAVYMQKTYGIWAA